VGPSWANFQSPKILEAHPVRKGGAAANKGGAARNKAGAARNKGGPPKKISCAAIQKGCAPNKNSVYPKNNSVPPNHEGCPPVINGCRPKKIGGVFVSYFWSWFLVESHGGLGDPALPVGRFARQSAAAGCFALPFDRRKTGLLPRPS
jgi:hypothetical protein